MNEIAWDAFPNAIEKHDPVWIEMPDGARLAATIWRPKDSDSRPVPAILEYVPYRRHDFTALGDSRHHPWFAGQGYASVRVDCRGSGDSDGIMYDEYLARELQDGADVIA
ncbi:MAG: CocE/NonD family hydrolase, partial [Alphaproteobacteria bacterium]